MSMAPWGHFVAMMSCMDILNINFPKKNDPDTVKLSKQTSLSDIMMWTKFQVKIRKLSLSVK